MDRPSQDAALGNKLVPAFDNTPLDLVAECQLRKFLGLSSSRELLTAKVNSGIKGADASLCLCGTSIEVNGCKHAVFAVVVRENTNAQKLHELTLHWATCEREGSGWVPPPSGVHQYPPSLTANPPGCGAWRTAFALHPSPDGKPLHVALLQMPMEGVLSSGGVAFVLNNGQHWMHNPHHGRDWFVQLSGLLPVTTDLENLPDKGTFPASLDRDPDEQERADRQLLHGSAARTMELQRRQREAADAAELAATNAAAAAAQVVKAMQGLGPVTEQLAAAEAAVQASLQSVDTGKLSVSAASAAASRRLQERAVVCTAAGASLDVDGDGSVVLAEAEAAEAEAAAAMAALKIAESALQHQKADLAKAEATLVASRQAHDAVMAELSAAEKRSEEAAEESRVKAAEAAAAVEAAAAELELLAEECSAAAARVWVHVEQRQMLALKRFIVEAGPNEPLNLAWLLPPSLSGRSLPVVPTAFNGVRNIQSAGDHGSWKELEPCSIQDLQAVMRSKLREWMKATPSQQLQVIQYTCSTRLPGGLELPVLVWVAESQEADDTGKTVAVLVIGVDQSAAGTRSGRLQLHWGAAIREGMAASQLVGPGWKTSSQHTWESSGCELVTPFTAQRVPKLGIGQLPGQKPAFAGIGHVSGDYCVVADGGAAAASGGAGGGAGTAASPDRGVEKQGHVVLLQLPLEGLFMHGGVTFTLKDSLGRHLTNAGNGKAFFLELGMMMQQLAYMTRPWVDPVEEQQGEGGEAPADGPSTAAEDATQNGG